MKDNVALITGTLTGIKRATVRAFVREGARVVVFNRLTKSGALESAAAGVRVSAVAPRPTDTGMLKRFTGTPENKAALTSAVPQDRVGKPDDIARTILFLASGVASFLTSQIVTVDGGPPQAHKEKPL